MICDARVTWKLRCTITAENISDFRLDRADDAQAWPIRIAAPLETVQTEAK